MYFTHNISLCWRNSSKHSLFHHHYLISLGNMLSLKWEIESLVWWEQMTVAKETAHGTDTFYFDLEALTKDNRDSRSQNICVSVFLKLRSFQWQKWKHYISSQTVPSQTIQPKNWLLHIELNVIDSKFSHILNFPHNYKFSILLHFDFFYKYNWLLATLDLTQWCVNSLQTTCFSSPISHTEGKVQIGNNHLGSPLWNIILFSCSI